jgi:uncharacterized protein (TIGR02099 family)
MLRAILSARHILLRFLASHAGTIVGRGLLLLATMLYFSFAIAVIALRYWVLPGIESYRPDIEQAVSFGLGRRVTIDSVEADWHGLNPYLALHKVTIYDESNRSALELGLVESTLSWSSLWHLEIRQHSLDIWRPNLTIRRDRSGQVYVAGIALAKSDSGDGRVADWLLAQHNIAVRDADLVWIDEQRAAPPLALAHVEFLLENSGSRHRFALRALPPREHASALELRGDLNGDSASDLTQWRGQIYANLDYADLAVWRAWIDYPIDLSQGRGGLRLWAEFREQQLRGLTADVGFADVIARLGPQLAPLELRRLQGRFQLSYAGAGYTGYTVAGTGVNFQTSAGLGMEPADFSVRLSHPPAGDSGEIRANALDLHELALLADYLPLDPAFQSTLAKYAPQGKVYGLRFTWNGALNQPQNYALQSRFTGLGVNPGEVTPGFSGLSGRIDADELKGTLALDSQHAAVELPALFEDPHVTFDTLSVGVSWQHTASGYTLEIGSLAFANADAAGSASGKYQTIAGGPGIIDVGARLTRADARQVARYLPLRVHENVRVWLARALLAGTSQDVRLKLKGDLSRFPFADDADGVFQVVAKVQGGKLNYGDAWPVIDNVVAEVVFQGKQLEVNATQGSILGTRLGRTKVEIPDLANKQEKWLNVVGTAEGPTAEFLRFIELSPVARITDDVTQDMRAVGSGKLALRINLPLPTLNHPVPLAKPKVAGSFQFASNQLTFVPSLPPITQFNGRLDFTESGLTARNLSGNFLGGATTLSAVTRPDTGVTVQWQGAAGIDALQRTLDYPWLKKLSGSAAWRTTIAVRHRAVDIAFDSSLAGIGSELPEPLKKSAPEPMPFHIERRIAAVEGAREAGAARLENWQLTLGKSVAAQWVMQTGAAGSELMRAGVAFGEAAQLPARGIVVSGRLPVLDFDQLRELAPAAVSVERSDGVKVNLKLGALDALGRRLDDVDFRSELKDGTWQTNVQAKEIEGRIDWQPKGQGRVVARLKQFTLPDASPAAQAQARRAEAAPAPRDTQRSGDLPELDLVADSFVVHDKQLGKLELTATNAERDWTIDKMLLSNPDGSMHADGVWQNYAVQPRINLNLHLESGDIGKLLTRLGFPGTMRRGQATLDGKLAWLGNPQSIDYPSLSGNLKLDAKQGQFSKIEPGIGKLLGILSLQSLPRRLTLDFNDVFSEGFAFDQITGNVDIARGVMTTKDLKIDGPAAKVQISGSTNLVNETQDLRVKVLPTVGEGVSLLGAFLINPIVGITSLVAQKVFKDPLSQFLAYEYAVTGTWGDPKVEKTRGPQALPAIGQGSPQTNPPAPLPLAGPSVPVLPAASKP